MRVGDADQADDVDDYALPEIGKPIAWRLETFPVSPPHGADAVLEINGAILTSYSSGRLRTLEAPFRWTRGAVYDAHGALVEASQRIGGLGGDHVVAADPATVATEEPRLPWPMATRPERRLTGTWLYAGNWMNQFGHFITETLTTLWPDDLEVAGIVAHPFIFGGPESDWQLELLELGGYGSLPRVLAREGLRVDRLLMPTRAFVPNGYATSMAARVWNRVAAAATPEEPRPTATSALFISRTRWHRRLRELGRPTPRELPDEELLDRRMEARGCSVIFPEEMSVREQISAVRSKGILIGVSGSALHLSAFARPGTRLIEISDARSGVLRHPNQRVIDTACGHQKAILPFREEDRTVDVERLESALNEASA
jgi:capsular polysaccharide biosynthesis protein